MALLAALTMSLLAVGSTTTLVLAQEGTLEVEVAETGSRFFPDSNMADADGWPTRGAWFVTEGYIYEAGTLTCADGTCNGVVYDDIGNPSPEFPDAVLGTWHCAGTHLEDAASMADLEGPVALTTQVFDFGAHGADTIVTSGYETDDLDVPYERAVVGGTGMYSGASGVQAQSTIGFNNPDLVIDDIPLVGFAFSVVLPA
jgi:hypothetical protein